MVSRVSGILSETSGEMPCLCVSARMGLRERRKEHGDESARAKGTHGQGPRPGAADGEASRSTREAPCAEARDRPPRSASAASETRMALVGKRQLQSQAAIGILQPQVVREADAQAGVRGPPITVWDGRALYSATRLLREKLYCSPSNGM